MAASKVLFILTGSIACYKACQALSRLNQRSIDVKVVATPAALEFIGNATIEGLTGHPVVSDLFHAGDVMDHIHLMRWADLIVVAPATANFINKAAQGVADDLVQTLFLAHDFKKPFLIAPAMNTSMYLHPITQKSIQTLASMGITILESASGVLACGEEGQGRLLEPDLLVQEITARLENKTNESTTTAQKPKVLVTAGGTQEPIDTVRSISNLSSGRTGSQIASFFQEHGFEVTLLKSHSSNVPSSAAHTSVFTSFSDLNEQMETLLGQEDFDLVIHSAAVSDYSVDSVEVNGQKFAPLDIPKMSSSHESMSIHLKKNFKILNRIQSYSKNKNVQVVAFKLTSKASPEEQQTAIDKVFAAGGVHWVVHNDLSNIDIVRKKHLFTLCDQEEKKTDYEGVEKLAAALVSRTLVRK